METDVITDSFPALEKLESRSRHIGELGDIASFYFFAAPFFPRELCTHVKTDFTSTELQEDISKFKNYITDDAIFGLYLVVFDRLCFYPETSVVSEAGFTIDKDYLPVWKNSLNIVAERLQKGKVEDKYVVNSHQIEIISLNLERISF